MGKKQKKHKVSKVMKYSSWQTTDLHEIEVRKKRAREESLKIKQIDNKTNIFSQYLVSKKGVENTREYKAEIRSLQKTHNYCSCPDFLKNSLGTCKHIEKILLGIKRVKPLSPFTEIFLDFSNGMKLTIIPETNISKKALKFTQKYLDITGSFKKPVENTLQVFVRDYLSASDDIKGKVRVSDAVFKLAEKYQHLDQNRKMQKKYADKLRKGAGEAEFLRHPLYDYQIDGMLHLAFGERGMLADEMGLGKTVQAVAAANVLHELHDIKRTLVICPASLKTEWEEQIKKFTGLSAKPLFGAKKIASTNIKSMTVSSLSQIMNK